MRARLAAILFGLSIVGGAAAAIVTAHYWSLVRAADAIGDPVPVTAAAVRVTQAGRGGTYASVSYLTDRGFVRAKLPQLGHDDSAYRAPVRLVYDARQPTRALLADDWRYGHSTRPHVTLWVAFAVLVLAVAYVLGWTISLVRLIRRWR